jgi:hypothetical protein
MRTTPSIKVCHDHEPLEQILRYERRRGQMCAAFFMMLRVLSYKERYTQPSLRAINPSGIICNSSADFHE